MIYSFFCNTCQSRFEITQSIQDALNPICPECGNIKPTRIWEPGYIFSKLADSEIKTVGHLAYRNAERMSSDEKHTLDLKHTEYKRHKKLKPLPPGMKRMKRGDGVEWPK